LPLGALPPAFRPLERPRVTLGFAYAAMIDARRNRRCAAILHRLNGKV